MSDINNYKTISQFATAEIVEKKSRFIATVSPISTEEEAQKFILDLKKKYYNATHNVYAYRASIKNEICRYSDDGEPSGTAGIPILNILNGEDIRNTVVVVTRFFGGTLLGTGGLVRAYSLAAKEGLKEAKIIEKNLYSIVNVETDYSLSGKVQYESLHNGHYIYDTKYESNVIFTLLIEKLKTDNFIKSIIDLTSGTAIINIENDSYGTKIDDKIYID